MCVGLPLHRGDGAVFLTFGVAQEAVVHQIVVHDRRVRTGSDVLVAEGQAVVQGELARAGEQERGIGEVAAEPFLGQFVAIGLLVPRVGVEGGAVVPFGAAVIIPGSDAGQAVVHQAVGVGVPGVDLEIDQIALGLVAVTQTIGVHIDGPQVPLRDLVAIYPNDLRGHDLALLALIAAIAGLQRLVIGDAPGSLQQQGFRLGRGVENLSVRGVQRRQDPPSLGEVVVVPVAREIVARVAPGVGGDQVEPIPASRAGDVEELPARTGQVAAIGPRLVAIGRKAAGAGVGHAGADAQAQVAAFAQDVVDVQRLHNDHAADAARGVGLQAGALVDGDARDQIGIQIGPLRLTGVAAVGVHGRLAAVDDDRHPALALNAADIDVQSVGDARVAGGHARHALDDVGGRGAAKPFDGVLRDIGAGSGRAVGRFHRIARLAGAGGAEPACAAFGRALHPDRTQGEGSVGDGGGGGQGRRAARQTIGHAGAGQQTRQPL